MASEAICGPERRSQEELIWSLVATTVTLLTAWMHLQHSYLGVTSSLVLLVHIYNILAMPTYPVVLFGLSACFSAHLAVLNHPVRFVRLQDGIPDAAWTTTTRHPKFVLWSLTNAPFASLQHFRNPGPDEWHIEFEARRPRAAILWLGHALAMSFAMLQCACSVVRGRRRQEHDAAAAILTDWRIFWTALSGVVVLTQSIALEAAGLTTRLQRREEAAVLRRSVSLVWPLLLIPGFILAWARRTDARSAWSFFPRDTFFGEELMSRANFLWVEVVFLPPFTLPESLTAEGATTYLSLLLLVSFGSMPWAFAEDLGMAFGAGSAAWPADKACPQLWKDPRWLPAI